VAAEHPPETKGTPGPAGGTKWGPLVWQPEPCVTPGHPLVTAAPTRDAGTASGTGLCWDRPCPDPAPR